MLETTGRCWLETTVCLERYQYPLLNAVKASLWLACCFVSRSGTYVLYPLYPDAKRKTFDNLLVEVELHFLCAAFRLQTSSRCLPVRAVTTATHHLLCLHAGLASA